MPTGKSEFETSALSSPNLSIFYKNGYTSDANSPEVTEPRLPGLLDPASGQPQPIYSGLDPNFTPVCHEMYFQKPEARQKDKRRHSRISLSNSKVCIKTASGEAAIAEIINLSRGGVYFRTSAHFAAGSLVFVATHYIEGGMNIFQEGIVVRVQREPSDNAPGEYAIQFSPRPKDPSSSRATTGEASRVH